MRPKPFPIFLFLSLFSIGHVSASDTTYHKKPLYFSISAGYSFNRAGGSLVEMVQQLNVQFGIRNAKQKDGNGFALTLGLQKQLGEFIYFKTGLGYIQKKVNPEEGSFPLYKDSLKTSYLSIPLMVGIDPAIDARKTIFLSLEAGLSGNLKMIDKSYSGPDRVGFKTNPGTLGFNAGGGLTLVASPTVNFMVRYDYMVDITNAYDETLYWGAPNEVYRTRSYKYKTSNFSIGLQWLL
jgi:hypothetical protein